jgi:thymidylate synthase
MLLDKKYKELIADILRNGADRPTRNARTRSVFGRSLVLPTMADGNFPLITARKIFYKGILGELAAFLQGPQNVADFEKQGCNYWGLWANPEGDLNVDYGNLWRDFNGYDQLATLIDSLTTDPYGRRHIISAWKPDNLSTLDLPCCHYSYQWYVTNDDKLDMLWIQRSVDVMIGLPSDMVLAGAFNALIAKAVGLIPGSITMQLGDCHIYEPHLANSIEFLKRPVYDLPIFSIDPQVSIDNFSNESITIKDYESGPAMKFELLK